MQIHKKPVGMMEILELELLFQLYSYIVVVLEIDTRAIVVIVQQSIDRSVKWSGLIPGESTFFWTIISQINTRQMVNAANLGQRL